MAGMDRTWRLAYRSLVVCVALTQSAAADLFINEIFFNPGGSARDSRDEYVELRGTPNMPLTKHFFVFVENEDDELNQGEAGIVEAIFDLNNYSLGTNGFLTLRQAGSSYAVASGTTDIVNSGAGAVGWTPGAGSPLLFEQQVPVGTNNYLEGGGFTAMVIRNTGDAVTHRPQIGMDLDVGNDGLDSIATAVNGWRSNWEIIDSIGTFGESGEAPLGRLYAPVNFGFEVVGQPVFPGGPIFTGPNLEPGAVYVGLEYEVEYLGRWGNSDGQTAADWHVSNLTDNAATGYVPGSAEWRQSGDHVAFPGVSPNVETNQGTPYGTVLTNTLGAPNYVQGDFNRDGFVDAADFTVWRDASGATGIDLATDANRDREVNQTDHDIWKARFGEPISSGGAMAMFGPAVTTAVPEPNSALLAFGVAALYFSLRSRSDRRPRYCKLLPIAPRS
ncbi:MAG: hypothetical protein O2931_17225 [Planctomycetota bacterium]|nr:hypothetical protein [Planctomycetota bacterium]MDA1180524.1 hypothetical protein [Planctomycetota bacterium]